MSNFIASIEKIEGSITDYNHITDLTKEQTMGKCVPFASWYRASNFNSATADNGGLNNLQLEFIDNSGNDALKASRGYDYQQCTTDYTAYIVEFGSDVTVQQIDVDGWTGTTNDVLISSLTDIDKTFCVFYYQRVESDYDAYDSNCVSARILDSTHVRLERGNAADGTVNGTLYVIEDTGSNFDVQHGDLVLTQQTTNSDLITSVTMAKSFVVASTHNNQSDDDAESAAIRVDLEDATHVRALRGALGTTAVYIKYQVVSLSTNGNVYRGLIDFGATQDQRYSAEFTAVSLDYSVAWSPTHENGSSSAPAGADGSQDVCDTIIKVELYSTTQIVADRLSIGDIQAYLSWEVIEWETAAVATTGKITAVDTLITYDEITATVTAVDALITFDEITAKVTAVDALITFDEIAAKITAVDALITYTEVPAAKMTAVDTLITFDEITAKVTAVDALITFDEITAKVTAVDALITFDEITAKVTAVDALITFDEITAKITAVDVLITYTEVPAATITAVDTLLTYSEITGKVTAVDALITFDEITAKVTAVDALITFDEIAAKLTAVDAKITFTTDEPTGKITAVDALITFSEIAAKVTAVDALLTFSEITAKVTAVDALITFDEITAKVTAVDALITFDEITAKVTAVDARITFSEITAKITAVDALLTFDEIAAKITAVDVLITYSAIITAAKITAVDALITYDVFVSAALMEKEVRAPVPVLSVVSAAVPEMRTVRAPIDPTRVV